MARVARLNSIMTGVRLSFRSSTDTIIANVAQQGSGLLLFLTLPNILPARQYAFVVVASVILSFTRFSDLGLSFVYGRELSRLYGSGDLTMVDPWNQTLLWFGVVSGIVTGVIAGTVSRAYGSTLEIAILLTLVPPLTAILSAYLSFATVRGEFDRYRDAQILLSAGRLLAIPLTITFGLVGWFIAQLAGLLVVLVKSGLVWIPRPPRIHWGIVKINLPSGVQLALIALLWFQLLDSARLLATIYYQAESIAIYGIVVAGYQSAYSLIFSAFMPISIKTLRLLGSSDNDAIEYIHRVIARSLPWVFLLAVVAAELAPWFLRWVFPQYSIDPVMPRVMIFGLSAMPILATVGNLLVGKKKNATYLLIIGVAFVMAAATEAVLREHIGVHAAVFGQAVGTFGLAGMLLITGRLMFARDCGGGPFRWWSPALWLAGLWSSYLAIRLIFVGGLV